MHFKPKHVQRREFLAILQVFKTQGLDNHSLKEFNNVSIKLQMILFIETATQHLVKNINT